MFEFVVQLATRAIADLAAGRTIAALTLSAAEYGLFELVYSDHLLEEIQRVVVDHKGLAPANVSTVHARDLRNIPERQDHRHQDGSTAVWWARPGPDEHRARFITGRNRSDGQFVAAGWGRPSR